MHMYINNYFQAFNLDNFDEFKFNDDISFVATRTADNGEYKYSVIVQPEVDCLVQYLLEKLEFSEDIVNSLVDNAEEVFLKYLDDGQQGHSAFDFENFLYDYALEKYSTDIGK